MRGKKAKALRRAAKLHDYPDECKYTVFRVLSRRRGASLLVTLTSDCTRALYQYLKKRYKEDSCPLNQS